MKTSSAFGRTGKLRASISIATKVTPPNVVDRTLEEPKPVLSQNTRLPAETTYECSNAIEKNSSIEIHLFFGDNEWRGDNVQIGKFKLKGFPPAPKGPSKITTKVSISSNQQLCIAVCDPVTMGYRSVGFVDLYKIEPPAIVSRPNLLNPNNLLAEFLELSNKGHMPLSGGDISHILILSFEEALMGVQKHIEVLRPETCSTCAGSGVRPGTTAVCPDCHGTGSKRSEKRTNSGELEHVIFSSCPTCKSTGQIIRTPCPICEGRTWVKNTRPFTLNIPSGIDSGSLICFPGQGEFGKYGGLPGQLNIIVTVANHPLFTRIGHDVFIHLPVKVGFAKRGGTLQVPDVAEKSFHLLSLPPDTHPGTSFRVYENDAYTLSAIVDIYDPRNPIALLRVLKRLRAIKQALNQRDLEVRD